MALDLNRKIGPLSVRAWALVGAGTFGLVYVVTRRRGSATVAEQDATELDSVAGVSPYDDAAVIPVPVSVGSSSGSIVPDPYSYGGYADPFPGLEGLEGSLASLYDLIGQTSAEELLALEGLATSLEPTPADVAAPGTRVPRSAQIARLIARRQAVKGRLATAREAGNRKAVARLRERRQAITRTIQHERATTPPVAARRPARRGRR
jgi:hypothetical protein